MRFFILILVLYLGASHCSNELSFRVTIPQHNGRKLWIYSDANDIVSVQFNAKAKMVDCDVLKKNRVAVKDLFYKALGRKIGSERVVQDMDVPKLARQCKKFLRDMQRKKPDDKSGVVKEFRKHQELRDGVEGTKWCKLAPTKYVAQNVYGKEKKEDKCCQQFHACNDTIDAYRAKDDLFNYNKFKLPSCQCQQTFTACLDGIKSHVAKHVHHLYFDTVGLTCFDMELEKTCVQWNKWYAKCNKYAMRNVAVRKTHLKKWN